MINNIKFAYNKDISTGDQNCKNILVKGNNQDVLPELLPYFGGKIKCVYIDPPYNNGDSYHYYNDNSSHDYWLRDIRNVLLLLKQFLKRDGSIWISIDDKEMAYLKVECDKLFGRENCAGTIVWQQRKSRENRAVFSCNHEYVLVYTRDIKAFKKSRNLLPVDDKFINSKYKNPDNDPRGPWQSIIASAQAGHGVPSQYYTIVSPIGIKHQPPQGRCWVYNEERMKREIAQGNIWFGLEGKNAPRIKKFLKGAKIGLTPETLWIGDNIGTTDSAKKHLLALFPKMKNVFDTPKPEGLIKQILDIATNEGDYVLDCYLGSGTTITAAHKLHRNYIGIELGDQMTNLVVKRLEKVIQGENEGISDSVHWQGGGCFSFYNFDKSKKAEVINPKISENSVGAKRLEAKYHQLNFYDLFDQYAYDPIIENDIVKEEKPTYNIGRYIGIDPTKNSLISLVKDDNVEHFLDQSAKIYYTGKKFPASVTLNNLYYFMPYIKCKGIRDLYMIKIARIGTRREGQSDNDPNDIRLVFEIEFVKQFFDDYKLIDLDIWHTFTDTTMEKLMGMISYKTIK